MVSFKCAPYFKNSAVVPRTGSSWLFKDGCLNRRMCNASYKPVLTGLKGNGRIAIGELGGGWIPSDIAMFCKNEGILGTPVIHDISTDGQSNNTGDPTQDASFEVNADIDAALAAYYFTYGELPKSIDMLWGQDITAVTEYAYKHGYDYLSWSWGSPEREWGKPALIALAAVVQAALAAGMNILAASGDNSSSDGTFGPNVDGPSSVPGVIACGGTSLLPGPNQIESVWGDGRPRDPGTGGGYSSYFGVQAYQVGVPGNTPGRMVPDVADIADPNTPWEVVVGGQIVGIGGTSLVAPFLTGFLAAVGPKLGNVPAKFWTRHAAFKEITTGSNGKYRASAGPNPCSGLGAVYGDLVADLLLGL